MIQTIIRGINCHLQMSQAIRDASITKFLLVHDDAYSYLPIGDHLGELTHATFCGFTPNPRYEDICAGVEFFRAEGCDAIVAVGGGSAMDVAKCIKLFGGMHTDKDYLDVPFQENGIPLIVLPTTAGTGSESTHFAVLYVQGEKKSVAHESLLPSIVFLDACVLRTLPHFQRKCTLLDALCQGIESLWSIRATPESVAHAETAIMALIAHIDTYLDGQDEYMAQYILEAANRAGQAINITQTTAPHAMSYKITSLYGIPHGCAVALCLPEVWHYMLEHPEYCVHPAGWEGLQAAFACVAHALGQPDAPSAVCFLIKLREWLALPTPHTQRVVDIELLTCSVNPQRLGNNPVALDEAALRSLYTQIVLVDPAEEQKR